MRRQSDAVTDIHLRPLAPGDLDRIHRWHNDRALFRHLGRDFQPVDRASVERWLEQRRTAWPRELNLAVCVARTGRHVGNIYLRDIDWPDGRAELHLFIGASRDRSRGIGTAATRRLCRHAFEALGLRRLFLMVLAGNAAAIRVYRRCGFRQEGRLRQHVVKDGRPEDVLVMGLNVPVTTGASRHRQPPACGWDEPV